MKLTAVDEDRIRDWLAQMAELVADGEVSAKTNNNARTCLSMTMGEAVQIVEGGHLAGTGAHSYSANAR